MKHSQLYPSHSLTLVSILLENLPKMLHLFFKANHSTTTERQSAVTWSICLLSGLNDKMVLASRQQEWRRDSGGTENLQQIQLTYNNYRCLHIQHCNEIRILANAVDFNHFA